MVVNTRSTDSLIGAQVRGPDDLGERLVDLLGGLEQEAVVAIFVDPAGSVTGSALVALGSCFRAVVEARDLFREAVRTAAAGVIIAHNHPSGSTAPTESDLAFTRRMIEAGEILGVEVLDQMLVTAGSWRSLRDATGLWLNPSAKD